MGELVRFEELTPQRGLELQDEFGGTVAIHRIFAMAMCQGARSLVVEENPDEREYKAEFEGLFKNITPFREKKTPHRLHFFEGSIKNPQDIQSATGYLGYVDIRPTPDRTVCWALLDGRLVTGRNNNYLFLTCCRRYTVKVAGRDFCVNAFPYMQQEGVAVRCAQASLATISDFLGCEISGPAFTDKTALDSPSADRPLPSPGLTARQICIGIRAMSREPLLFDYTQLPADKRVLLQAEQTIYSYVESGIPVLVGIDTPRGRHALVAIGHTFTPDSWMAEGEPGYYDFPKSGSSINWVRRIVVQDDNFGPYTLLPTEILRGICFLIAAPLPKHIYLEASDALESAKGICGPEKHNLISHVYCEAEADLKKKGQEFSSQVMFWRNQLLSATRSEKLVLRPRLVTGAEFSACIQGVGGQTGEKMRDALSQICLPENVWRIELSWPEIFCHQRLCVGELVLDASHPLKLSFSLISQGWFWFRIPGCLVWRNLLTEQTELQHLVGDEGAYAHHTCTAL